MRIIHMFQWQLKDIINSLEIIKKQGFEAIQISPVQPCKEGNEWWCCYQPKAFEIGNKYGSKKELIELCTKANELNIKIIADVICNHVANAGGGMNRLNPHPEVAADMVSNSYFWKEKRDISNWNDRREVINYCMGLPGLETSNYDLQDKIIDFLNSLIDCGVSGYRFDAAKNIALPSERCDFWIRVLNGLKKKDLFNYAEVIFTPKNIIDQYCKYINVLTDSFGSDKNKLVTFCETHDSYLNDGPTGYTKRMSDGMVVNEYRILTKNYPNTLFYCRPFNDTWMSDEIRNINTRK